MGSNRRYIIQRNSYEEKSGIKIWQIIWGCGVAFGFGLIIGFTYIVLKNT